MLNDIRNIYCYHKNFCKDTLFTQQINNLNKFCDKIRGKNAQNQIFADKSAANSGNFEILWTELPYLRMTECGAVSVI